MGAAYFKAAIPEPYRILGLKLKPFSLGHYFILRRFECSFVDDEKATATLEDLIFAVSVCSMSYKDFLEFIERKYYPWWSVLLSWVWPWHRPKPRFVWPREARKWGKQAGLFDFKSKVALFMQYLNEATEQPQYWVEEEGKPSGAHWAQALYDSLIGQVGYTQEQALNNPLAQCLSDFYRHAESVGSVRLMTDQEVEVINGAQA